MSKTPIEPSDIRKGDLIRYEFDASDQPKAVEYQAEKNGGWWRYGEGQHYLLDRPEPKVELPTEDGWYESAQFPISEGFVPYRRQSGQWCEGAEDVLSDPENWGPFTKIEPVPVTAKEVIDALRKRIGSIDNAYDFQAVATQFGVQS